MLTEKSWRNPTNNTALEMDAVAVFFWNRALRTRLDKKRYGSTCEDACLYRQTDDFGDQEVCVFEARTA